MPNELITPNLHVVLIHYPLGLLIAGTMIELFSFLWRRSSFRVAGRWMILIGAMSAIPATFSGIYALRSIARVDMDSGASWAEVKATSPVLGKPEVWDVLRNHMLYQSIATGIAALVVLIWLGGSDAARESKSLRGFLLLMLLFDMAIMIKASHLGGEAVFKKGVAVEAVFPIPPESPPRSATQPVNWTNTPTKVEAMLPPLEMHITMAGVAVAIAIVSIGLSFRRINATREVPDAPIVTGDPASTYIVPRTPPSPVDMVRTFNPALELEHRPFAPAGRFWMLSFLLALATFLGGIWVIARGSEKIALMKDQPGQIPKMVWEQVRPEPNDELKITNYRSAVHFVAGGAIVLLPIVLAGLARFAPRRKVVLSFFTLLLALAVTTQIWVGVLLLYDTGQGKLLYFNHSATVENQPQSASTSQ